MTRSRSLAMALVLLAAAPAGVARADTAIEAYTAMGLKPQNVLSGSVMAARVLPGADKQVVAMVTYLTGKRDEATAVNVRLEVFAQRQNSLSPVYSRDFGKENGGYVGQGEVQLVDLDGDGVNEIIATYDNLKDPPIEERTGEVILRDSGGFRTAWSGAVEYDATRAARKLPAERRDHFEREVDVIRTLKTHGLTLFMAKKMIAVAGERMPEPKIVTETFPLRSRPQ